MGGKSQFQRQAVKIPTTSTFVHETLVALQRIALLCLLRAHASLQPLGHADGSHDLRHRHLTAALRAEVARVAKPSRDNEQADAERAGADHPPGCAPDTPVIAVSVVRRTKEPNMRQGSIWRMRSLADRRIAAA